MRLKGLEWRDLVCLFLDGKANSIRRKNVLKLFFSMLLPKSRPFEWHRLVCRGVPASGGRWGSGRGAAHPVRVCRQQSSLLCQEPCISLALEDASAQLCVCVLSLQPSLSWLLLIDLWIN